MTRRQSSLVQQPEERIPERVTRLVPAKLPLDDLAATRALTDQLISASILVVERRRLLREAEAEVKRLMEIAHG